MSIYSKSIERRLYFVSLWSFDIGVLFCNFFSCISIAHCQIDRIKDKKITPLKTWTSWVVSKSLKLATVFLTGYIRVELLLGSFCIFIIPKRKQIANFSNPKTLSWSNTSKNVTNHINIHFYNHSWYFLIYTFLTIVTNNI